MLILCACDAALVKGRLQPRADEAAGGRGDIVRAQLLAAWRGARNGVALVLEARGGVAALDAGPMPVRERPQQHESEGQQSRLTESH